MPSPAGRGGHVRLVILGGGGFRVPLVYGALLRPDTCPRVDEVVLHDLDADRLAVMARVLRQLAAGGADPPSVRTTGELDAALEGATFVFSAIRVGGLSGRVADERVALDLGVVGQETIGPGGLAYGLRTVPVAVRTAERIAAVCPDAWVVNFTNPAGMVTEAMQRILGDRVVGICDSPEALVRRACRVLQLHPARVGASYVGRNHLGWLQALSVDGVDQLPALLADDAALSDVEEARLLGVDWVRQLGCLPNEYLFYYYFTREAVAAARGGQGTRGELLRTQQARFYADAARDPESALAAWRRARRERDSTYLAELRAAGAGGRERDPADLAAGGYAGVAVALMAALAGDTGARLILDVRNGSTVSGLPAGAVVEVPCVVDAHGARPVGAQPLAGAALGLVQQVDAVERLAIEAAVTGSAATALSAFALHPLVDSVSTARALLDGYRARIPELAALR